MPDWNELIFSDEPFDSKVSAVFEYQVENNAVYRRFCEALSYPSDRFERSEGYPPLLPVKAFKDAVVTCRPDQKPALVFRSSGTSGMERSRHLVADKEIYRQSLLRGFGQFYEPEKAVIWAYTPGYSEHPDSSLIFMLKELIGQDASGLSRFLPLDRPLEQDDLHEITESDKNLILFGAAFGLLDLLEREPIPLPGGSLIIETGGMKTRRREITRGELHEQLADGFDIDQSRVHSEFGMCELLSQAYATGGPWFRSVPWMQVTVRNPENPGEELPPFKEGLIGVVDLANVHSCSFVLTGDRGVKDKKGRFKVLGRWNPKDLRGCNFLIGED